MKVFHCDGCRSLIFFDNDQCLTCGRTLGYLPSLGTMSALEPAGGGAWRALANGANTAACRQCANGAQHQVCNWLIEAGAPGDLCASCHLNQFIPDLKVAGNQERWLLLEKAKRRLVYTLLQLGLPTESTGGRTALRFSFLGDVPNQTPVVTGHANGLITVNIAEADDAERERRRVNLNEPYRTLLGHFRHEVAHYYWDRLIADSRWLEPFRALFGSEQRDYAGALRDYYQKGAAPGWQSQFISAYATSHPWEDWAETWAHYFHITDTVETAASFGMTLETKVSGAKAMLAPPGAIGGRAGSFVELLDYWFPLTYALNSLNRAMGLHDLYPFALSEPVIGKLRFIDEVVRASRQAPTA